MAASYHSAAGAAVTVLRVATLLLLVASSRRDSSSSAAAAAGSGDAHKHHHHTGSEERVSDGGVSPKDTKHYHDDGSHNVDFDHEAILGSEKNIAEFENLSPSEAKSKLMEILGRMDVNGDGKIDREELTQWIYNSFKALSEEDSREKFLELDQSGVGTISWEQYREDAFGITSDEDLPSEDEEGYEDTVKWLAEDRELWSVCDADGDGRLSVDEYVTFSLPEESRHTAPGSGSHAAAYDLVLARVTAEKDVDGDGKISLEEFLGERRPNDDTEWYQSEAERFSQQFDVDKSGTLEGSGEIGKWLMPGNRELSEEESDHLMSHSDDDGDGSLSKEEVMNHWRTFVTSSHSDDDDDDEISDDDENDDDDDDDFSFDQSRDEL